MAIADVPANLLNPWFNTGEKQALNKLYQHVNTELVTPITSELDTVSSGLVTVTNDLAGLISDLAADDGGTVIGYNRGSAGTTDSNLYVIIKDRGISLNEFTGADSTGVANSGAAVRAWLTALNAEKRKGYANPGTYMVDYCYLTNMDNVSVELHPGVIFKGTDTVQIFNGNGLTGQQFTVTEFTLSAAGAYALESISNLGVVTPLVVTTNYTVAGTTITLAGATTIPVGHTLRVCSSDPIISLITSGSSTNRTGNFYWEGGRIDASLRGVATSVASGSGITIQRYKNFNVHGAQFYANDEYVTGLVNRVGDSGFTTISCDNGHVTDNLFQGWMDLGCYFSGGADKVNSTDDGVGVVVSNNHFVGCVTGFKASRQVRNTMVTGNNFEQCWIGAALWPASDVSAGRGSIVGNYFRRNGRNAIDVRQQVGSIVSNNTIIDFGYLVDGVTAASPFGSSGGNITAIALSGCKYTKVSDNVICYDDLAPRADTYGCGSASYLFDSVTYLNNYNSFHDNDLQGLGYGFSEAGTASVGNKYRNNILRDITTTEYNNIASISGSAMSGTYTPTLTNTTNIDASTAYSCQWSRSGDVITVSGTVDIDPTAAANTTTELRMTLPVATSFAGTNELGGTGACQSDNVLPAKLLGLISGTGQARMQFSSGSTASRNWNFIYSYRIT